MLTFLFFIKDRQVVAAQVVTLALCSARDPICWGSQATESSRGIRPTTPHLMAGKPDYQLSRLETWQALRGQAGLEGLLHADGHPMMTSPAPLVTHLPILSPTSQILLIWNTGGECQPPVFGENT